MKALLARLYPYFPVALQNAGISAYGYVYKYERFGRDFQPTLDEFQQRDSWDHRRMREYVDVRLRHVLTRSLDVPFYREQWRRHGITAESIADITVDTLSQLPILSKDAVRRNPMAFVHNGATGDKLLTYFSSGSTGTPIRAICTRRGQQRFAAAREARSYRWAGTSIRRPRAMVGGQQIVPNNAPRPPYYRYNMAERQVYLSAYHISPATIRNYVAGLNRYRPESITGYAFSQFDIARLMLEQGLTLAFKPTAAITSSEKLTARMRDVIERAFGCTAFEEYGSVENCVLATECERGRLHVSPDFGVFEIVDDAGRAVPAGVEGRIVATGLLNDAQLLIRYEIGDRAIWSTESCPCGRNHLPVLQELTGRLEDVVVGPDGRHSVRFHSIFIELPHVLQGQVVQEGRDEFRVRVIAEDGFGASEERLICQRIKARLGSVNVRVERVTELERTRTGKVRAVISRIPNGTRAEAVDAPHV